MENKDKEQRVIKFRAWCESLQTMLYHGVERCEIYVHSSTAYVAGRDVNVSLLQFTGLTDKEGKEIYEGDIITSGNSKGVIEYGHGKFGINWDYGTDKTTMLGAWGQVDNLRTLDDDYNSGITVIGNIYQNPELIK